MRWLWLGWPAGEWEDDWGRAHQDGWGFYQAGAAHRYLRRDAGQETYQLKQSTELFKYKLFLRETTLVSVWHM